MSITYTCGKRFFFNRGCRICHSRSPCGYIHCLVVVVTTVTVLSSEIVYVVVSADAAVKVYVIV